MVGVGLAFGYFANEVKAPAEPVAEQPIDEGNTTFCAMDAMQCPDGSFVGRTGPHCEFVCPVTDETMPADVVAAIEALADRIVVTSPSPLATVDGPLVITGQARGNWFFEASFPVSLVNWDGVVIANGIATALGDWMTEDFVPFTSTLNFVSPYNVGDPAYMANGTLILERDNPSGLPEHDASLEIPVRFSPTASTTIE